MWNLQTASGTPAKRRLHNAAIGSGQRCLQYARISDGLSGFVALPVRT
jgi:hypothetical protein